MKKLIVFIFMLILLCSCASPASHSTPTVAAEKGSVALSGMPNNCKTAEHLGVHMEAISPTSTGMIIHFTQSGGNYEGIKLFTGSYYVLEQFIDNKWSPLPYIIDENVVGWEDIAYVIPFDGSVKLEENWAWLYGDLPIGIYRIGKEIYDFGNTGIYSRDIYYLEFAITN